MSDRKIDIENWNRKGHFLFFKEFTEPFHGMTVDIDCTQLLAHSKVSGHSFFALYLHKILKALNKVEALKLRIRGEEVWLLDQVSASATLSRSNDTFGFSNIEYDDDIKVFSENIVKEKARLENEPGLNTGICGDDVIHFSALPWIKFTSLSHARNLGYPDSCPKISVGKVFLDHDGNHKMPLSIHVHHALVDALPIARFLELLEEEFRL